ncbi:MAG TPA: hypothetical protein VMF52_17550 [Steroidobacteraceae bacterium]|nr:hypothetical protein [Steroidobacteraceae bacterium]
MIVTLAAWLYLIQALLTLGSLFWGPFGGGGGKVATLGTAALFGAMGFGLLNREQWGRWLALGCSLLTWALGGLALVLGIGAAALSGQVGVFFSVLFSGSPMAIFVIVVLLGVLMMIANVIISAKLFFHLCSPEGCDEFGVPHGSAPTVAASAGAWVVLFFAQFWMSTGGSLPRLSGPTMARDQPHPVAEPERSYAVREAERLDHERALERALEADRQRSQQDVSGPALPDATEPPPAQTAATAADESPAPALYTNNGDREDERGSATKILKCRDAAGAVTFTQGYCPAGTKRVDMPAGE